MDTARCAGRSAEWVKARGKLVDSFIVQTQVEQKGFEICGLSKILRRLFTNKGNPFKLDGRWMQSFQRLPSTFLLIPDGRIRGHIVEVKEL